MLTPMPARSTVWRSKNRERARAYTRAYMKVYLQDPVRKAKIAETVKLAKRKARRREKLDCIAAYGGECSCCAEGEILFLTIDHVNNDGAQHRKRLTRKSRPGGGASFYQWLRKQGYPKDKYRCLCFNCNCGRQLNKGICPHKESTRVIR